MVDSITKRFFLLALVVGIGGFDRVSKDVAASSLAGAPAQSYLFDVVRLSYAENPGSFLGLGADLPGSIRFLVFTVGAGVLLAVLIAYALRFQWRGAKFFGFALFVAGGTANWADRVSDGQVVDFLNVGVGPIRTGIFNVADVAILAGAVILIVGQYWQGRKERHGASRCA
jgi:signal peptidase II